MPINNTNESDKERAKALFITGAQRSRDQLKENFDVSIDFYFRLPGNLSADAKAKSEAVEISKAFEQWWENNLGNADFPVDEKDVTLEGAYWFYRQLCLLVDTHMWNMSRLIGGERLADRRG